MQKIVNETAKSAEDKSVMFSERSFNNLFVAMQAAIQVRRLRIQESGATAVEYALMVGLMALAIIGGVTYFGERVTREFNTISNTIPTNTG